jgi:chromosome segregation ATPase
VEERAMSDKNLEFWEGALRQGRVTPVNEVLKDFREAVEGYDFQIMLLTEKIEELEKELEEAEKMYRDDMGV